MSNDSAKYTIDVQVTLHEAVLDPQGQAILQGLRSLGFPEILEAHAGKYFRLVIEAPDAAGALTSARSACDRLLSNPVIETYTLRLEQPA